MHLSIPFALLILIFNCTVTLADTDDNDKRQTVQTADTTNDADAALVQVADIETQPLESTVMVPEFSAFGTVLTLEPLLALRQQYLAAQAQQDSAEATYQQSDLNLNRTRNLYQHDIVSTRRLQEQQAQWRNDRANLATSNYQQQTLLATSRLQWGNTLTTWFTQNHGKQAEQFLNHETQLLEIILPANTTLHSDVHDIEVELYGRRDDAIPATLISSAPQVDPVTQGKRYFFKIKGNTFPFGAHISAWIPTSAQKNLGVVIPEKAVVWHLGQALVFIRMDDSQFSRRILPELIPVKGGYFAADGFEANEEIVISGAQTLLSQELKNLIPDEDDD